MKHLSCLIIISVFLVPTMSQAYVWDHYTVGTGLPDDHVRDLVTDNTGGIWAATTAGLGYFKNNQWSTISSTGSTQLAVDGQGRIWSGGSDGQISVFSTNGDAVAMGALFNSVLTTDIIGLAPKGQHEMWVLTRGGLWLWQTGLPTDKFILISPNNALQSLSASTDGSAWLGDSTGLLRVDGRDLNIPIRVVDLGSTDTVGAVQALSDDTIIFTTNLSGRVFAWSGNGLSNLTLPAQWPAQSLMDIAQDNQGRIWLSGQDALRFETTEPNPADWPATIIDENDGLFSQRIEAVMPLITNDEQQVWFASQDGIFVRRSVNWEVFNTDNGLLGSHGLNCGGVLGAADCNYVDELIIDPQNGTLWAGGSKGLSRRTTAGAWTGWATLLPYGIFTPLAHPEVQSLGLDSSGNLWVGTGAEPFGAPTNGGLQVHRNGTPDDQWEILGLAAANPRWFVYDIAQDHDGNMWTAAHDGLWRFQISNGDTTATVFTDSHGAVNGPTAAVTTNNSYVAVAAREGQFAVLDLSSNTWTRYNLSDFMGPTGATTLITDILLTADRIHVATAQGLIGLTLTDSDLVVANLLGPATGFGDNLNGLALDADGFLLVTSTNGLYRLDQDYSRWRHLDQSAGLSTNHTTSVVVDGQKFWLGTQAKGLMYHEFSAATTVVVERPRDVISSRESLSVVVTGVDSDGPDELVAFQWRVDNAPWEPDLPSNDHTITFVPTFWGLSEGRHQLEIRAIDVDFNVEEQPLQIRFELDATPPVPQILQPRPGDAVAGSVTITGSVDDVRFDSFLVRVWPSSGNEEMATVLTPWGPAPATINNLANWTTTDFADGQYILEVAVRDTLGIIGASQVSILVDNEFPHADLTSPVLIRAQTGGTVYAPDGSAYLQIPPFALAVDQIVHLTRIATTGTADGTGYVLRAEQDRFTKAAVLTVVLSSQQDPALTIQQLVGSVWKNLGGSHDGSLLTAAITDLGTYGLIAGTPSDQSGDLVTEFAVEPRHFRPHSGVGGQWLNISFNLARSAQVEAAIYSRNGRPRKILRQDERLTAGRQVISWDGRAANGELLAAGLYIVNLNIDGQRHSMVIQVGRD